MVKLDPILIGPIAVGKSTVATLMARQLGLPQRALDDLRWSYYNELGYDHEVAKSKHETEGLWGVYRYWRPFEAHAVERMLSDYCNCVFDFGAGHSVYEDEVLFKRVQQVLLPYANVILLLPSANREESLHILNERTGYVADGTPNMNEHFLRHHSNDSLAKFTVYTQGKTPAETAAEIIELMGKQIPAAAEKLSR